MDSGIFCFWLCALAGISVPANEQNTPESFILKRSHNYLYSFSNHLPQPYSLYRIPMAEQPQKSLNQLFKETVRSVERLGHSNERQDSKTFQDKLVKLLGSLLRIRHQVYALSLFSDNETLDDLNTKDIKFLGADYYFGELLSKKVDYIQGTQSLDFDKKLKNLTKAREYLIDFLIALKNYRILNEFQLQKIDGFKEKYEPKLEELRYNDPALRREEKIANFKLEKQINENIQYIEKKFPKFFAEEEDQDENSIDEESLRELYLSKLRLLSLKTFTQLEMLNMETQVLKNRPRITEISDAEPKIPIGDKENHLTGENDYGYTEKLESINKGKDQLLSKEGKVLQPFTIVSKKDDIQKKVFGYGQTLPTMSVEEYIDEEIKRGGIKTETITGEEKEESSDDSDDDDEKVYEKREWDEFKDEHHRGEGNMKNKG